MSTPKDSLDALKRKREALEHERNTVLYDIDTVDHELNRSEPTGKEERARAQAEGLILSRKRKELVRQLGAFAGKIAAVDAQINALKARQQERRAETERGRTKPRPRPR